MRAYPGCSPVPCDQFDDAFTAVEQWLVGRAVLPIENSLGGSIHRNYDLLLRHRLHIVGEVHLPVHHCLLALPGTQPTQLTRVLSHPQALAQCEATLNRLGVVQEAVYDTAGAAQMVANQKMGAVGAVASTRAAEIYGLEILAEGIQDEADNFTRFLALARDPVLPSTHRPFKVPLLPPPRPCFLPLVPRFPCHHTCLSPYLPLAILASRYTCLSPYLPLAIPASRHTCLSPYLPLAIPASRHTCLSPYLPACTIAAPSPLTTQSQHFLHLPYAPPPPPIVHQKSIVFALEKGAGVLFLRVTMRTCITHREVAPHHLPSLHALHLPSTPPPSPPPRPPDEHSVHVGEGRRRALQGALSLRPPRHQPYQESRPHRDKPLYVDWLDRSSLAAPAMPLADTPASASQDAMAYQSFDYLFYIDFQASLAEPRVQNAMRHLQEMAPFLRVLGSYPMDVNPMEAPSSAPSAPASL
ncbi:unnamed protein product [Closterium sp. Yama58-4]|nr:unnamed protein product [Closterium sp. Yama58-4]